MSRIFERSAATPVSAPGSLVLGPVDLAITEQNSIAARLRAELGAAGETADLVIAPGARHLRLGRTIAAQSGSRGLLKFSAAETDNGLALSIGTKLGFDLYRVRLSGDPYSSESVICEVDVPVARDGLDAVTRPFTKLITRDYSSVIDVIAKNILYEIVDPLLWCRLLNHGATLAHAAAAQTPDGAGILIFGTGGVGKSTTVLSLVRDLGWRYIADDLVILAGGQIVRYPKHLQVYAYNVDLVQGLEAELLQNRPALDRFLFRLRRAVLGPKHARRRIPAATLFGQDSVSDRAPLAAATLLIGTDSSSSLKTERVSHEQLAQLAAATVVDEFWDFSRLLNGLATIGAGHPSVGDLFHRTREIIMEQLAGTPTYVIQVPARTPGTVIGAQLEKVAKGLA
ncbi:MAG: hypothetical protein O7C67_13215 [Gammaproteobacteria bacterium]|nr:hypothetical protein [Gammaproteobacteria bacterium]